MDDSLSRIPVFRKKLRHHRVFACTPSWSFLLMILFFVSGGVPSRLSSRAFSSCVLAPRLIHIINLLNLTRFFFYLGHFSRNLVLDVVVHEKSPSRSIAWSHDGRLSVASCFVLAHLEFLPNLRLDFREIYVGSVHWVVHIESSSYEVEKFALLHLSSITISPTP